MPTSLHSAFLEAITFLPHDSTIETPMLSNMVSLNMALFTTADAFLKSHSTYGKSHVLSCTSWRLFKCFHLVLTVETGLEVSLSRSYKISRK